MYNHQQWGRAHKCTAMRHQVHSILPNINYTPSKCINIQHVLSGTYICFRQTPLQLRVQQNTPVLPEKEPYSRDEGYIIQCVHNFVAYLYDIVYQGYTS